MNQRNASYILPHNPRQYFARVDDKLLTKQICEQAGIPVPHALAVVVEEFKERYIDEVLRRNGENRTKTARDLGVDARTVFRYLERKRARLEGRKPEEPPEDVDAEQVG